MINLEKLTLLDEQQALDIAEEFGTPVYVYSQKALEEQADKALNFPNAFGLTVRYAMKANPNKNILRIFHNKGIGRMDLPGGSEKEMADSLQKLEKINYKILCPGHV